MERFLRTYLLDSAFGLLILGLQLKGLRHCWVIGWVIDEQQGLHKDVTTGILIWDPYTVFTCGMDC